MYGLRTTRFGGSRVRPSRSRAEGPRCQLDGAEGLRLDDDRARDREMRCRLRELPSPSNRAPLPLAKTDMARSDLAGVTASRDARLRAHQKRAEWTGAASAQSPHRIGLP